MHTAQLKKNAVIAAVVVNIIAFAALQAADTASCKPNAQGMCMFRKAAANSEKKQGIAAVGKEEASSAASGRQAFREMAEQQTAVCGTTELTWAAQLTGELSALREELALAAKKTGLLLLLPQLAKEYIESCTRLRRWNALCSDYRKKLSSSTSQGIPFRALSFPCSEES